MKYPNDIGIGPKTETEALCLLFSMLGNAYNIIAQYEAEEAKRESERIREHFTAATRFKYDRDDIECLKKAADQLLVEGASFEDRAASAEVLKDIADRMYKANPSEANRD